MATTEKKNTFGGLEYVELDDYTMVAQNEMGETMRLWRVLSRHDETGEAHTAYVLAPTARDACCQAECGLEHYAPGEDNYTHSAERIPFRIRGWGARLF